MIKAETQLVWSSIIRTGLRPAEHHLRSAVPRGAGQAQHPGRHAARLFNLDRKPVKKIPESPRGSTSADVRRPHASQIALVAAPIQGASSLRTVRRAGSNCTYDMRLMAASKTSEPAHPTVVKNGRVLIETEVTWFQRRSFQGRDRRAGVCHAVLLAALAAHVWRTCDETAPTLDSSATRIGSLATERGWPAREGISPRLRSMRAVCRRRRGPQACAAAGEPALRNRHRSAGIAAE